MLEKQDHSTAVPKGKSSSKVEKPERKWVTFLDPGPPKSGRCTWRRHFVGVPAAIMGYLQSLAARDAERFAYPSISTIARKAVPGRTLDRGYIGEVLRELKNRLWVEQKPLERNGRQRRGWVVKCHDQVLTLSSEGADFVTMKCGLSRQGMVTKSASETTENRTQSLEEKRDSSVGGKSESSIESSIQLASSLAESARSLLERIGFDGKITSTKLLNEIGKLAQGKWTRKKDGMKLGIEEVPDSKVASHLTRWKDRCNLKGRKLPVELLEAIEYFDNSANVSNPSRDLPEDW